jgi:hypothetical protein|tara:strand:+ start:397 stop:522 length:126 start_codon:yes stop_codon:yes gene_type:complete
MQAVVEVELELILAQHQALVVEQVELAVVEQAEMLCYHNVM